MVTLVMSTPPPCTTTLLGRSLGTSTCKVALGGNEVSNFAVGTYDDYVRDVAFPPAMPENATVLVDD